MRNLIGFIVFSVVIACCKKNNSTPSINLSMIEHKWNLVSENGEALRYVGTTEDYYDFSANGMLYKYVDKAYDTLAYSLQPNNSTILFYQIMNGIRSTDASAYQIKVLTASQFVISHSSGIIFSLDSLKR